MKNNKKMSKGITLIALVVTIIVLLILAGISIQMISGNNSILSNATKAKEATRGGEVLEMVSIDVANNVVADKTGGTKKTKGQVISELYEQGKLTNDEVAILEESNIIVIGGITIDFSKLESDKKMISFEIKTNLNETPIELECEEGMTWAEWAQTCEEPIYLPYNGAPSPNCVAAFQGSLQELILSEHLNEFVTVNTGYYVIVGLVRLEPSWMNVRPEDKILDVSDGGHYTVHQSYDG